MDEILAQFKPAQVLSFDEPCARIYRDLRDQKIRVGKIDLRSQRRNGWRPNTVRYGLRINLVNDPETEAQAESLAGAPCDALTPFGTTVWQHLTANDLDETHRCVILGGLVNDWSARDIQKWESAPLGPFTSNFATSISPWVITLEAVEPFPTDVQDPAPLPYLQSVGNPTFYLNLEVSLQSDSTPTAQRICSTNRDSERDERYGDESAFGHGKSPKTYEAWSEQLTKKLTRRNGRERR